MSEQFVLIAWPPSDKMLERAGDMIEREFGESDWEEAKDMAECLNPRPIYDAMCAASPVAADDPAVVERVTWAVFNARKAGGNNEDIARDILRLFSPPKE